MRNSLCLVGFVGALTIPAQAATIMIGDNDGYGFGAGAVPDNSPFLFVTSGFSVQDNRSGAEAAASDGSEQTDFYSAVFTPLPFSFTAKFLLPNGITGGTLEIDMGGFQASTFGETTVDMNGIAQPGMLAFEDGPDATAVRDFVLSAAVVAAADAAGELDVTFDRAGNSDAISFDYFSLDFTPNTQVIPNPAPGLLGAVGLSGLGLIRRRRLPV